MQDYDLLHRLGEDDVAEQYLARKRGPMNFEKLVVLHKIHQRLGQDQKFIKELIDQNRRAASMEHANLASVFDAGVVDGSYFLVTEHLQGRSMAQVVARSIEEDFAPEVLDVVRVVADCARALSAAHMRVGLDLTPAPFIHGDVGPDSVVVLYNGGVKLRDLGMASARELSRPIVERVRAGELSCVAPERLDGRPADVRTDVFGLGLVLWNGLTRRPLVHAAAGDARIEMLRTLDAEPPSRWNEDVPAELDAICARALHRDPDARYQSAKEMQHELERFLRSESYERESDSIALFMNTVFADDILEQHMLMKSALAAGQDSASSPAPAAGKRASTPTPAPPAQDRPAPAQPAAPARASVPGASRPSVPTAPAGGHRGRASSIPSISVPSVIPTIKPVTAEIKVPATIPSISMRAPSPARSTPRPTTAPPARSATARPTTAPPARSATPTPLSARASTPAPIPARGSTPAPVPARAPTPAPMPARASTPAPMPARASSPVRRPPTPAPVAAKDQEPPVSAQPEPLPPIELVAGTAAEPDGATASSSPDRSSVPLPLGDIPSLATQLLRDSTYLEEASNEAMATDITSLAELLEPDARSSQALRPPPAEAPAVVDTASASVSPPESAPAAPSALEPRLAAQSADEPRPAEHAEPPGVPELPQLAAPDKRERRTWLFIAAPAALLVVIVLAVVLTRGDKHGTSDGDHRVAATADTGDSTPESSARAADSTGEAPTPPDTRATTPATTVAHDDEPHDAGPDDGADVDDDPDLDDGGDVDDDVEPDDRGASDDGADEDAIRATGGSAADGDAAQYDRDGAERLYKQGVRYFVEGKSSAAKRRFRKAIEADPTYAPPHRGLGLVYESAGRSSEAVRSLRMYLRLDPEADDKDSVLARISRLGGS